MTDLARVLPNFPVARYAGLVPALEKHDVSVADLLTLDAADIGKRTRLPLLDLQRLSAAVLAALHADLGVGPPPAAPLPATAPAAPDHDPDAPAARWRTISTLDDGLDAALGGGVPVGTVTEITGESGTGKTQLLLALLLAVQLPPPRGLGRPALYLSTEAPLATRRLAQLLAANPHLRHHTTTTTSSSTSLLDGIVSAVTPDLESQDHILTYQVPVEVARRRIGLVVLDSVAANYRAEFDRRPGPGSSSTTTATAPAFSAPAAMGARGADLARLGMQLRDLARQHGLAVVVANQVADRFDSPVPLPPRRPPPPPWRPTQESPLAARGRPLEPASSSVPGSSPSPPPPPPPPPPEGADAAPPPAAHAALALDHQQRWFTGWGDDPYEGGLKTPSLGLVWTSQVGMRLALLKRPAAYALRRRDAEVGAEDSGRPVAARTWQRWMKIVFAPHVAASGPGIEGAVEFDVAMGGLKAVEGG